MARPNTPDEILPTGGRRITTKRCCNGCGNEVGDLTDLELYAAIAGRELPDVRDECGCQESPAGDTEIEQMAQGTVAAR